MRRAALLAALLVAACAPAGEGDPGGAAGGDAAAVSAAAGKPMDPLARRQAALDAQALDPVTGRVDLTRDVAALGQDVPREAHTLARSATTTGGSYHVAFRPLPDPPPINEPFELEVTLTDAEGAPVTDAGLWVSAWMPEHAHGMHLVPRVVSRKDGLYRLRGMLFHMDGLWQLDVDVVREHIAEGVRFELQLISEPMAAALAVDMDDDVLRRTLQHSPLPPAPRDPTNRWSGDEAAAELGRALFFDAGLSVDGSVSCGTCHLPERAFADGRRLGRGLSDLERHTPALWNQAHNRWYFWDGRADSLWHQALMPLEDPREHGFSRLGVVRHVAQTPALRERYEALFGSLPALDGLPEHARPALADLRHPHRDAWLALQPEQREALDAAFVKVGKALAAYVERLVSDRAPFDVFVEGLRTGDERRFAALDDPAQRGLEIFMGRGNCHVCHAGPNFTDLEFHDIRVPVDPDLPEDLGRRDGLELLLSAPFNSTGVHSDDREAGLQKIRFLDRGGHVGVGQFKTPSLRNVAVTAPYMHQGQFATLEEVVHYYSTLEGARESMHPEVILKPLELSDREQADLVAFLESLTDLDLDPRWAGPPP